MKKLISIEDLKKLCNDESIILTQHLVNRVNERGIKYDDIKSAILNGEIIEQYLDDYPYPSCLVLGYSIVAKELHVVIGISENRLWFITAYYPSLAKWESDYKTRKEEK